MCKRHERRAKNRAKAARNLAKTMSNLHKQNAALIALYHMPSKKSTIPSKKQAYALVFSLPAGIPFFPALILNFVFILVLTLASPRHAPSRCLSPPPYLTDFAAARFAYLCLAFCIFILYDAAALSSHKLRTLPIFPQILLTK